LESGVIARLADDASFAAELGARNEAAAAAWAARPVVETAAATRRAMATTEPTPRGAGETGGAEDGAPSGEWEGDGPEWPDESAEAAMQGELRQRDVSVPTPPAVVRRKAAATEAAGPPLPGLDEAKARVPAKVLEVLDELFRAQFSEVRRVPEAVLKDGAVEARNDQ
jgi:hypothetical protein